MEIYKIDGLSFAYPGEIKNALSGVSFSVYSGEFITLCGPSGCGKSTLLRQLKSVLAPHGTKSGEILFCGESLDAVDIRRQSSEIGFVMQSPESQIVTDKVWHELSFGLESLGLDTMTIRGRVSEMASFFGIQNWFYKNVTELSGGQKQLLNLASVMAMQPSVLILDEPTSQLDPIAASDFLASVGRINRELGTTVIITEHRFEEVFPLSDRVVVLDSGRMIADGKTSEVGEKLRDLGHSMFMAMPTSMRIWASTGSGSACPVTVCDGKEWLREYAEDKTLFPIDIKEPSVSEEPAISVSDVWFKYEKDLPNVVKGLELTVHKGEIYALLGGNGAGKSTSLSVIGGLRTPYRGEVKINGRVGMLPQDPKNVFVKKTVAVDLEEICSDRLKIAKVVSLCRLGELLERHPYDLSGGEQQRAALAKVLLLEPDILLMDEPTKGLDAEFKAVFASILRSLRNSGVTVLLVSHDVEFCAEYADRCGLFFDGSIAASGTPHLFFSGNSFYTTSANRMSRDIIPDCVTANDVITSIGGEPVPIIEASDYVRETPEMPEKQKKTKLPIWRKLLAVLGGAIALLGMIETLSVTDLSELISKNGLDIGLGNISWFACAIGGLLLAALAVGRKDEEKVFVQKKQKLTRRTAVEIAVIFLLIPLTFFVGVYYFGNKNYYLLATLILIEAMAPFALVFEGRKPQPRELVVIAVMCAIGVAGRAAFMMLPNFKPVLALVIISGVALGGESGFLVGAMTMLTSNVLFGQGPWTPWQMFSMGLIGFIAGLLFRKGLLRRNKLSLCIFGALSAVIIYGGIMNPVSALMWSHTIQWKVIAAYYVTGLPMDIVHASATFLTLWFAAEPMLEKLDRIKEKYGLLT